MQGHDSLEESRCTSCGFGVSDLGFDCAQCTPLIVFAVTLAKDQGEATELGGVACGGTRSVCLNQFHGVWTEVCDFIGTSQCVRLTSGDRRIHAFRATIGAGTDTGKYGINTVTVALGIVQPLESNHAQAFAEHGAVGVVGKGPAITTGTQCRCLGETHVHKDVIQGVHAAGDHQVGIPEIELTDGHAEG